MKLTRFVEKQAFSHSIYISDLSAQANSLRLSGSESEATYTIDAATQSSEHLEQVILVRDLFGNPFHRIIFDSNWRTSVVLGLTSQIDEFHQFGHFPILADALEDAGCNDAEILSHCRGSTPHVRGCWVIDLILDKK